jgi:hypothetical protein
MKPTPTLKIEKGPSGPVFVYRYGIYELAVSPFAPASADKRTTEHKICDRLIDGARAELAAAGEQTDLEIMETLGLNEDAPPDPRRAFFVWGTRIARAYGGILSRLGMAAQFLSSWQLSRVIFVSDVSPDIKFQASLVFAHAYHMWHMEFFNEHEEMIKAMRASIGSAKGSEGRKTKAQERRAAILSVFIDVIDNRAMTCGQIAMARFKTVNRTLESAGLKPIRTEDALEKAIARIRAERQIPG